MAQNIRIRNNTFDDVPALETPRSDGGGVVDFWDTSDATATAADVRNGVPFYGASGKGIGAMTEKAAATITPTGSAQTIAAGQYLTGAQTIEGVTTTNLTASNIVAGVTVKVGTASDDDSVLSLQGTAQVPVISQDATTKIVSIS